MITPSLVKAQILQFLPVYTDLFADPVFGSAVISGSLIAVNSTAHGLETGDVIPVSSAEVVNPITGVSFANGIATLATTFSHDRTDATDDFYETNIAALEGFADSNYNGDFEIQSLPSRTEINISRDADVVGDLGDLFETRFMFITSYEVTKVDDDNFTVVSPQSLPDGTVFKTFKYVVDARVYIASSVKRALAMYTLAETDKAVMFIIFGAEAASKSRESLSDSISSASAQNPLRITYLPMINFLVFLNVSNDLSGAKALQSIYGEIGPALRRTMYAHGFSIDDVSIQFRAVEANNEQEFYDTAAYAHSFTYQLPYQITQRQGSFFRENVSLEHILVNAKMFDTEGALIEIDVDLEP